MISIIIPTYNEATNIQYLIKEINEILKEENFEMIVADDDSPDGTGDIVKELEKDYPVRLLLRKVPKEEKGLSNAVVDAFKIAEGDILGVIDADFSHPPEKLKEMIKAMKEENADIAIASRLVPGGGTENWPNSRKITSYLASSIARPLTKVKDPMSGYFMIRKEVIQNAPLKPKGYKILLEILGKGNYKKVKEIPFVFKDRTAGKSKLTMKVNMQYLEQIIDLYKFKIKNSFQKHQP